MSTTTTTITIKTDGRTITNLQEIEEAIKQESSRKETRQQAIIEADRSWEEACTDYSVRELTLLYRVIDAHIQCAARNDIEAYRELVKLAERQFKYIVDKWHHGPLEMIEEKTERLKKGRKIDTLERMLGVVSNELVKRWRSA